MNKLIRFPAERTQKQRELTQDAKLAHDECYVFIKELLQTVKNCGLELPGTVESLAQKAYAKINRTGSGLS